MRKSTNTNSSCELTINYRRYISQIQTINETIARLTWNGQFDWVAIEILNVPPPLPLLPYTLVTPSDRVFCGGFLHAQMVFFFFCLVLVVEKRKHGLLLGYIIHTSLDLVSYLRAAAISVALWALEEPEVIKEVTTVRRLKHAHYIQPPAWRSAAYMCSILLFVCLIVWLRTWLFDPCNTWVMSLGLMLPESEALKYTFSGIHRHS